jgi:non-canonical purine NTP pyrophosphatase (RdgB/HAM1 family)
MSASAFGSRGLAGLVFATSNPDKAREASRLLGRELPAKAVDVPEIQSLSFEEVARAKALAASAALGLPVIVEDSGLAMAAWGGFPGPFTKWITMKSLGHDGLAQMLDPFGDRRATAVAVVAIARPGSYDVLVARGETSGKIAFASRGENGFGWDVIFVPDGETRTFAEMRDDEKDALSHRARAFAALKAKLEAD